MLLVREKVQDDVTPMTLDISGSGDHHKDSVGSSSISSTDTVNSNEKKRNINNTNNNTSVATVINESDKQIACKVCIVFVLVRGVLVRVAISISEHLV